MILEWLVSVYIDFSYSYPYLAAAVFSGIGGAVAILLAKNLSLLGRLNYFLYFSLFSLVLAVMLLLNSMLAAPALLHGWFSWVILTEILLTVVFGFFVGRIAVRRSFAAYGHKYFAPLAFVPIASLLLFAIRNKGAKKLKLNLNNTLKLCLGGVMYASSLGIGFYIQSSVAEETENAAPVDEVMSEIDLNQALMMLVNKVTTPVFVDNVTYLIELKVNKTTLQYIYQLAPQVAHLDMEILKPALIKQHCSHEPFISIFKAGGSVEHVYHNHALDEFGRVLLSFNDCQFE